MRVAFGSFAANAWGRGLLRQLAEGLATVADRDRILGRTRDAASVLFQAERATLPDRQARLVYGLCVLVLAGYREILAATGDAAFAAETVRVAYLRTHQAPTRRLTRVLLRLAANPAPILSRLPMAWLARRMYGAAMEFSQEKTAGGIDLIVNRCAFHQFFVAQGEPGLTRIFCGWDRNWMDLIEGSDRPIRIERSSTLSTGGDCCRFRFLQATDHEPGQLVDIVLDHSAHSGSGHGDL